MLTLPAFIFVLVWLHQRLPIRVQWLMAILLAAVGPIGYVVVGGDQWWNWGQMTPIPLLLLAITREPKEGSSGSWGSGVDGPWGPP